MHIIDQLRADLASAHLRQQAARFGRLAVVAFAAQLVTLGTSRLGWSAVAALAVGAVEVAYRQWVPTVPWPSVAARLRELLPGGTPAPTATYAGFFQNAAVPSAPTTPPAADTPPAQSGS